MKKNLLTEFNKSKYSHGIWSAVFLVPFLLTPYLVHAAIAIVSFYYGRELNDAQRMARIDVHKSPFKLMLPWQWHKASQWDYWTVLIVAVAFLTLKYGV